LQVNLIWSPSTNSTNDLIKEYPSETILLANQQRTGRGSHGKSWTSEPGNFYFTYKKKLVSFSCQPNFIAILTGVAVHQALSNLQIEQSTSLFLKWPNDLLNHQQEKVGGILIEKYQDDLLIGIGLNTRPNSHYAHLHLNQENLWLAYTISAQINLLKSERPENIIFYWQKHAWKQKGEFVQIKRKNQHQEGFFSHLGLNGQYYLYDQNQNLISLDF
jgi:biotin-[acetyl-CoA-carboxylase] ligase BirA-like protein